jgi:putative transcriptional regulator
MKNHLFEELLRGVREGGAILRGKALAARESSIDSPDVAEIRAEYGPSQEKFAALLGIRVHTLQTWEQGRHHPQ